MLFNSIDFLCFLFLVAVIYSLVYRQINLRNSFLLGASYFFYGWWDVRFLLLLVFSTGVDFFVACAIDNSNQPHRRRWLLGVSLATNLGILGYFKYAGFFVDSTARLLAGLGMQSDLPTLNIVLPVGISFYTFQTLSYTIDVYRGQMRATRRLLDFALYVAFFPQLVAGPIERAKTLLPQLAAPISYRMSDFSVGVWLILFGYFKKVFVADNIAASIDPIFLDHSVYTSPEHLLAVIGFSLQIYGDFSGYSDIARGIARCLGFRLMVNFRLPYFSLTPSEFWRRWHISLSTWLRDYLYIPLGGNRGGHLLTMRNLFATMLLGGLWHGASARFVAWGAFHSMLLIAERLLKSRAADQDTAPHSRFVIVVFQWLLMMTFTQIGWLIFRAPGLSVACQMITSNNWVWSGDALRLLVKITAYSSPLIAIDIWMQRTGDLLIPAKITLPIQCCLYTTMLVAIIVLGFRCTGEFIYFQF